MASGLETGDSVKGSDYFFFFRGERASQSAGRRLVQIDKLVEYLNDPTVLTNFA